MTLFEVLGVIACALATALTAMRWLRIAQREHYLAGRITRFAIRWWRARWWAGLALGVGVAAAVACSVLPALSLVAALVTAAGPPGLALRGRTSKLRWTRRLKTAAAIAFVLEAACGLIAGLTGGGRAALVTVAILAVLSPALFDAALAVAQPIEDRLSERYVRRAASLVERIGPRIVAITGSYGKTSTKRYLAHLLEERLTVVASPGSFNNRAGLARTVNELLAPGTDVLIAEMGAYGPGEIAALCRWLPPTIAVITAIGPVHLERFRTLDRTLRAKSEIAERAATVVLNVDDDRLVRLASELEVEGKRVVRCGSANEAAAVRIVQRGESLEVWVDGTVVDGIDRGRAGPMAALTNVACALGAAIALGVELPALLARLSELPIVENRLEVTRGSSGILIIDDTYNANPAGVRLALTALGSHQGAGRRVVVTPGMVELGPRQVEENAEFAAAVGAVATDLVVVGRTNRRALLDGVARAAARGEGDRGSTQLWSVPTREDAVSWVRTNLVDGDLVLYENDLPDHFP